MKRLKENLEEFLKTEQGSVTKALIQRIHRPLDLDTSLLLTEAYVIDKGEAFVSINTYCESMDNLDIWSTRLRTWTEEPIINYEGGVDPVNKKENTFFLEGNGSKKIKISDIFSHEDSDDITTGIVYSEKGNYNYNTFRDFRGKKREILKLYHLKKFDLENYIYEKNVKKVKSAANGNFVLEKIFLKMIDLPEVGFMNMKILEEEEMVYIAHSDFRSCWGCPDDKLRWDYLQRMPNLEGKTLVIADHPEIPKEIGPGNCPDNIIKYTEKLKSSRGLKQILYGSQIK